MEKKISANITEEFIEAITTFADHYVSRIQVAIYSHASEIADDVMLRTLLMEYNKREKKYQERKKSDAMNIIKWGMNMHESTFEDSCLNHARSYHDVIADAMKGKGYFDIQVLEG